MKTSKHLVIGDGGQIGAAVKAVLSDIYQVEGIDKDDEIFDKFDVIHVCIPGNLPDFVDIVDDYQQKYLEDDGLTIIHSTVPIGTSSQLGAVHSPVRGIHPDLEEGVRTFVKYFGGDYAEDAAQIFEKLDVDTVTTEKAETTELAKILSTTQYGVQIIVEKEIKRLCDEFNVDFDTVYTSFNETYNMGYEALNRPEYKKPVLKHIPGPLGGHCVKQNTEFLDSWMSELINKKGDELSKV